MHALATAFLSSSESLRRYQRIGSILTTDALGNIRMKAILFSFVRSFDFELAVPPTEITRKTMIVGRPFLTSDPQSGPQLPIIIRPAKSE